jgi:hypothetical protein
MRTLLPVILVLTATVRAAEIDWSTTIPEARFGDVPLSVAVPKIQRVLQQQMRSAVTLTIVEDTRSLPNFKRQVVPKPHPEPLRLRQVPRHHITNIPAVKLLRYIADGTGAKLLLKDSAAFLYTGGTVEAMIDRQYLVSRGYGDGQTDLREELAKHGVIFYEGGFAHRDKQKLTVRTTQKQHDTISALVD